jgi:hypothetical protein
MTADSKNNSSQEEQVCKHEVNKDKKTCLECYCEENPSAPECLMYDD